MTKQNFPWPVDDGWYVSEQLSLLAVIFHAISAFHNYFCNSKKLVIRYYKCV